VITERLERILAWLEGDGPDEPVRAAAAREARATLDEAREARTRERMVREILNTRNADFEEKVLELSIVKEVGDHIARFLREEDLLGPILSVLVREVGAGSAEVLLLDPATGELRLEAQAPPDVPSGLCLASGLRESEGMNGWLASSREPLAVEDLSRDFRFRRIGGTAAQGSVIAVPLVAEEQVLGVLHVYSPAPSAFRPAHVRILRIVAGQVAAALLGRRLHRELVAFSGRVEAEVRERTEELERKTEDLRRKNATITDLFRSLEEAQHELEDRNRQLARALTFNDNIVETVNVGIGVVDQDGRIVTWNRAMEHVSGGTVPKEKVLGRHYEDLPADARDAFGMGQELADALTLGRPTTRTGHVVDLPSGMRLHLNLHHLPVSFQRDGRHHAIIVIEDVTANVALHAQQVKAERLTAITATMVSVNHEVNNPLAVILGYVQMLQARVEAGEDPRAVLARAQADLARIEAETLRIRDITARLAALIEPVVTSYPASGPGVPMVDLGRSR
jgi:PAS domain S-box-containing protein